MRLFKKINFSHNVSRRLINTFLLFLCFQNSQAQNISAVADRNKILIGEQVTVQLKADESTDRQVFIKNWFNVSDTSNHIQIVKREPVDTIQVNGYTSYIQNIIITSFDSGHWQLSPLRVFVQDRATGKQTVLETEPVVLDVLPVNVYSLINYHDIKDIIPVNVKPDYTIYIAIILSLIILATIAWLVIKNRKNKNTKPAIAKYKGTPLEYALEQIKALEQENLPVKGQEKLYYTRLTAICRDYFKEHLHIASSQATSDELMIMLGVYLQNETKRPAFYQFLRLADAVKFAKYSTGTDTAKQSAIIATDILKHIDTVTKGMKEYA